MPQKKPLSREAARRKRLLVQRRRRRRMTLVAVCCIILLIVVVSAIRAIGNQLSDSFAKSDTPSSSQSTPKISEKKETEKEDDPVYEPASVSLIAVGDNLIHNTLLKDASNGDGTYDFTSFYENIKPYVQAADIAFVNQESPLGTGEPAGYPCFNTPQACGEALIDAGFDVIGHANNHAMDSGASAMYDTLDFWDSHVMLYNFS